MAPRASASRFTPNGCDRAAAGGSRASGRSARDALGDHAGAADRAGQALALTATPNIADVEGLPTSASACSCIDSAAAAASSTNAAFCCVTSSICVIAWFTCSIPLLCSTDADAISPMMSVTRFTALTISFIVVPCTQQIAGHLLEASPHDIEFRDGQFRVMGTDKQVPIAQVAFTAYVPHNYPPDKLEPDNDGLLTASEVATLRLDADWVILSACETRIVVRVRTGPAAPSRIQTAAQTADIM